MKIYVFLELKEITIFTLNFQQSQHSPQNEFVEKAWIAQVPDWRGSAEEGGDTRGADTSPAPPFERQPYWRCYRTQQFEGKPNP